MKKRQPKPPPKLPFLGLAIASNADKPLHRQIYEAVRTGIISGKLVANHLLPSTRSLAKDLGVSRTSTLAAYDQLIAEGFIRSAAGSGTFVAAELPDEFLHSKTGSNSSSKLSTPATPENPSLSERGKRFVSSPVKFLRDRGRVKAFQMNVPALDCFPFETWKKLMLKNLRQDPEQLLNYSDSAGYAPLRAAIADFLTVARGISCSDKNIIVTAGSQQALNLTAKLLVDPGDKVWIENPGYYGARGVFADAGAKLVDVPVDAEGIEVECGIELAPQAKLAYVTPSHKCPMGVRLSLARRYALLKWARAAQSWIIEDDYDSVYRYAGRPLQTLLALDKSSRVIYTGSFSTLLFPSLRLGYLVVPEELAESFAAARALTDWHSPLLDQMTLAAFISEGHLGRHYRRMRQLYAARQTALFNSAARHLNGLLDLEATGEGLHLVGRLPPEINDREAARQASLRGIEVRPLSMYQARPAEYKSALLLGFAAFNESEIETGVILLAQALNSMK